MITGKKVFEGNSDFEIIEKIVVSKYKSPLEYVPGPSEEVLHIVERAMDSNRDKRYQYARDMQYDLEKMIHKSHLLNPEIELSEFLKVLFSGMTPAEPPREKTKIFFKYPSIESPEIPDGDTTVVETLR